MQYSRATSSRLMIGLGVGGDAGVAVGAEVGVDEGMAVGVGEGVTVTSRTTIIGVAVSSRMRTMAVGPGLAVGEDAGAGVHVGVGIDRGADPQAQVKARTWPRPELALRRSVSSTAPPPIESLISGLSSQPS